MFSLPFQAHNLLGTIRDQHDAAQEINEAVSKPGGVFAPDYDDDELMAELEALTMDECKENVIPESMEKRLQPTSKQSMITTKTKNKVFAKKVSVKS